MLMTPSLPGTVRRLLLALACCAFVVSTLAVTRADAALPGKQQWLSDVDDAMQGSKSYVRQRVERGGVKLAVNLDIDNTSLETKYAEGRPVPRVLDFTEYARSLGVVLLFNTGRLEGDGRLTRAKRQLTAAGYVVTRICGRQPGEGLVHSKQRCRRGFVADGYTVVANVGNRATDFEGGDYERAFSLPNYGNQLG